MTKDKDPVWASDPERPDRTSRPTPGKPKPEHTAAGEQHVLSGAKRTSEAELVNRRAEQPLKSKARQKPAKQIDLVRQLHAAEAVKPSEQTKVATSLLPRPNFELVPAFAAAAGHPRRHDAQDPRRPTRYLLFPTTTFDGIPIARPALAVDIATRGIRKRGRSPL
jgi:hypothetical protein